MNKNSKPKNNKIEMRQTEYERVKEAFIIEILHDLSKPKLERLQMIEKYDLFSIDPYLPHIFINEEEKLENIIKEKYSPSFVIVDDMFNGPDSEYEYERNETVIIPDLIKSILESEEPITVVTARSAKEKIEMSKEEVIDKLYNWCVETKQIGFKFDW